MWTLCQLWNQGTVILHPWEYPDGFIIVLVASALDEECGTSRCTESNVNTTHPNKRVWIHVGSNGSDADYALATMSVIIFYMSIIVLTCAISLLVTFRHKLADFETVRDIITKRIEEMELPDLPQIQMPNIDLPDFDIPVFSKQVSENRTVTDGLKLASNNIDKIAEVVVGEVEVDSKATLKFHRNGDVEIIGKIEEKTNNVPHKDVNKDDVILRQNGTKHNPLDRASIEFIDDVDALDELQANDLQPPKAIEGMLASVEDISEDEAATEGTVAMKIFEGFGEVLFKEFIIGREPVSIIHYARPGSSIKWPTPN